MQTVFRIGIFERRPSASRMPKRQRDDDADEGDDQRHHQPAPQRGLDMGAGRTIAAEQQEEGDFREDDEQQDRVQPL
jgi:hypothetical protein